jgi:hypothetical protein
VRLPFAIITVVALIAGCRKATNSTRTPSDLQSLVGHQVRLEGRFGGPGKLADYITVGGEQIYLMKEPPSGRIARDIAYGSTIGVEGVLSFWSSPPLTEEEKEQYERGPGEARIPDHFYIDNVKVHLIRAP